MGDGRWGWREGGWKEMRGVDRRKSGGWKERRGYIHLLMHPPCSI